MKLFYKCIDCHQSNKISALLVGDRLELARKKGVEFESRCQKCGSNHKVHVDDVEAENDLTILIAGIASAILGIFLTTWFWEKGFIAVASFSVPILVTAGIANHERNKIKAFNFGKYDSKRGR